jgi:hypothetical protein
MEPVLVWLLTSLLAIALLGERPLLGLTLALLGGVALGLSAFFSQRASSETGSGNRSRPSPGR